MCMWEISDGDTKFFSTMKLVPLEDLGCLKPKVSKCWKFSMQALFSFLMLGQAPKVSGANREEEEEEAFLSLPKKLFTLHSFS